MKIPRRPTIPEYRFTQQFIDDLRYFVTRMEAAPTVEAGLKHAAQAKTLLDGYVHQRLAAK